MPANGGCTSVRSWFGRNSGEIKRVATGLAVFTVLASLVVAYSTAIQDAATRHPTLLVILGAITVCAMTTATYLDRSRYVFLIAIPLVVTCAVVWVLLTVKTLRHIDFYTSTIAQSVKQVPARIPTQPSALSPEGRKQFNLANRQLTRSSLRLRHHLDRHAFWSRTLLGIAISAVAIGFLPKIFRRRPPPAD